MPKQKKESKSVYYDQVADSYETYANNHRDRTRLYEANMAEAAKYRGLAQQVRDREKS